MNSLTKLDATDALLHGRFLSVIVTDILRYDGETAQTVTLTTHRGMWEETVMGISRGLRGGGKAKKWQSRVFSVRDGQLVNTVTYKPVFADKQQ